MVFIEWFRENLRRIALWIKSKITLERAGYLFAISLVIFIVLSMIFPDSFRLTLGISVLTITMMYLIMISSNIELQRATQTQVKAFVEQLQEVGKELKKVGSELSSLINVMREVQISVAESLSVTKRALEIEEAERKRHKELIKPQIHLRTELRGVHWWFIDNRHLWLIVANSGNDAEDGWLTTRREGFAGETFGPYEIKCHKSVELNLGHVNNFIGLQNVEVQIKVRDVERNPYSGTIQLSLNQTQLIPLQLSEAI